MNRFVEWAAEVAREAGTLLTVYYERRVAVEYKPAQGSGSGRSVSAPAASYGDVDVVTEADRASEQQIVERIRARFPEHAIVAEEGGGRESSSAYCWYVDPLDGTTNFAHGFPFFCVSLGLAREGEMVAAAVFDPLRNELFTAERGAGAFLNNRPLHVSKVTSLAESLLGTGFPSRKRHENPNIHFYHQVTLRSHGVRRAGSAALDLAYVAAGRLDGFWEFNLNSWDTAAGWLLVEEAGGRSTDMHSERYSLESQSITVSNGLIHAQLIQTFAEIFRGDYRNPLPKLGA